MQRQDTCVDLSTYVRGTLLNAQIPFAYVAPFMILDPDAMEVRSVHFPLMPVTRISGPPTRRERDAMIRFENHIQECSRCFAARMVTPIARS